MDSDAFSSILSTLFVASLVLFLLYRYMTSTFTYFSERGIPGPKPIPIFGNLWGIWRVSLPDHDRNLVKKYGKIFGYFDGSNPSLWVTDPEFIKAIFVKDFDHFTNRRNITFESKVVRRMVSSARGQEWKDIRSSITPAFTTGKIKRLIPLLGERVFLTEGFQFFIRLLENLIKERKESEQKYQDFVEAATETITDYTKEVDGKSSVLFLLAGFDTTATTLTNIIFLLALNPEIQNRLHQEIKNKLKISGEVNHDILIDFPYIDQVINEVLRVYPPVPRVERECNKDVTYNGIEIKKGTMITVPSFALHYDPDSGAPITKLNVTRTLFFRLEWGLRNCVGMRFAMEEIKIALCTIVSQFRFFRVRETPMQFDKGFIQVTQPVNAIVGIERRPTLAEPQQQTETEK
ncbi:hypothetical protein DAPPUDRAFT_259484 [Daphnia pulex]|uniref:Cytochrome P450 n=1 Tax=Daphnia pulex TaxID=6669 RepID=E9HHA7_DAPPU|nr:hypothetical protein DAPPUDRAFT_259484 [Daphnia pulex]|eukprot:EFX68832.1 hypothetical protein DAPPUDRAFT_259484 [Daphnia pulex]